MTGNRVKVSVNFPIDVLAPLTEDCFGDSSVRSNIFYMKKNLLNLFDQVGTVISNGDKIVAKEAFGKIVGVKSRKSLNDLVGLVKRSEKRISYPLSSTSEEIGMRKRMLYDWSEIINLQEMEGYNDSKFLKDISEFSIACYIFCMQNVIKGRRIGYIPRTGSLGGQFMELEMDKFIPYYGELVEDYWDSDDFINNAPVNEVEEYLADMKIDFAKMVSKGEYDDVLKARARKIVKAGSRLAQDEAPILRKILRERGNKPQF